MTSRQRKLWTICTHVAKTGESVTLDGIPVAALKYIRREIARFNVENPPWEVSVSRNGDALVVCFVAGNEPMRQAVRDELLGLFSLKAGGDLDSVLRGYYDRVAVEDVVFVSDAIQRKRAASAVDIWNKEGRGDVVLRKYRGAFVLYRRQWLKGRNFDRAMSTWRAITGR